MKGKILNALEALPANVIYSAASKNYVLRGFEYYRQQRLLHFNWNNDSTALIATVRGNGDYSVVFSFNGHENITFSCDCLAWSPYAACKHVICTLIAVKSVFRPNAYGLTFHDKDYLNSLSDSLLGGGAREAEKGRNGIYEVIIDMRGRHPDLYVRRDGERIDSPLRHFPHELNPFYFKEYHYRGHKWAYFSHYLNYHSDKHPLYLITVSDEMRLIFDDSLHYSGTTEINTEDDAVRVGKICSHNGRDIKEFLHLRDYIVDLREGKIGLLQDKAGWDHWNNLKRLFRHSGDFEFDLTKTDFSIPEKRFRHVQFVFPRISKEPMVPPDLILKTRGQNASISQSSCNYRMTIIPPVDKDGYFVLKAECELDGMNQPPYQNLFDFFTAVDSNLNHYLRADKRREFLYQAFFNMLSVKTKKGMKDEIKESLTHGDFRRYSMKHSARSFLNRYCEVFSTPDFMLQFGDKGWSIYPIDKEKELLLYKIPYEIFGWRIFKGIAAHDEMLVEPQQMHENLPLLYERSRENDVELFFENKSVVCSKWDFAFDARRESGIDWFEIRPEIRCNGKIIDDALFMEMLKRKSVYERDGVIRVLDANSQRILNVIAGIYENRKAKTDRQKEIVRVPRLQILDWMALRKSGVRVKLPPDDEEILSQLQQFESIEARPLPGKLKAKLRPYQKDGYNWLSFLYEHKFGACLADDMGLGKTIQAISLIGGIKEAKVKSPYPDKKHPHLIIVPPSLIFNWESEIGKFYPGLKMYCYTGKERQTVFDKCDVVITTYAISRRDIDRLKDIRFDVIIFDEAQAVKNIYADTTGAVRQLTANFKLVMTGTPLENHIGEYYSILDLILPGLLGEYETFMPLTKQSSSPALDMIIQRTRPFVLRRTKDKILKELPPKTETDIYLDLTEKQKALYKKTVEQVKMTIDKAYVSKTEAQAKIIALTAILKLRQLCVTPQLLSPDIKEPSPKIEFLVNKLKELKDEGHSSLVFSQFTSFLDILEEYLKKERFGFLRLDGSTPVGKRKKIIESFQSDDGASVFLLSLKAGGQGLNLTKASYVFHLDPWWNPAVENQASDRAHRIGQKNKVTIVRILTRHTIEEKMMELKKKKLALYKAVMEDSSVGGKGLKISKSDFNFLLGY